MYLGIDLGTSEVKVLLLASDGRVDRHRRLALYRFASASALGRTESRRLVGRHARGAGRAARANIRDEFAQIRGIGLSGQMHGAVLLDAQDRVLRPAILWNDMRSDKECAELTERAPELHADRRQSRDARIHRAEAAVGGAPRAGNLRADRLRAAAEGLSASATDRRQGVRSIGCSRHAVARRRQTRLVRLAARRLQHDARADAGLVRRQRAVRHPAARRWRASSV